MSKDKQGSSPERVIYSVSRLTERIKTQLEASFREVWVEGEVSNLRAAPSGHIYFTIKDDKAVLSAVLFRGSLASAGIRPGDGMRALFCGSISLYPPRGSYQLIVRRVEELGTGDLHQRFEALKKKLYQEGLFDDGHKKPLPLRPRRVGVVTSPGAAALQDILRVSFKRFPAVDIVLYPSLVQGENAAAELQAALRQADRDRLCDVLILSRGGGSLEDLWPFNDEALARTVFACSIPVVSGVGHEIDFTISDFVADRRAPTPSAAAELVFPERTAFRDSLDSFVQRMDSGVSRLLERARNRLQHNTAAQLAFRLTNRLNLSRMGLDDRHARLLSSMQALSAGRSRQALELMGRFLGLDPRAPLQRGFALVRKADSGQLVRQANVLARGDAVSIEFQRGQAAARVESVDKQ